MIYAQPPIPNGSFQDPRRPLTLLTREHPTLNIVRRQQVEDQASMAWTAVYIILWIASKIRETIICVNQTVITVNRDLSNYTI